LSEDDFIIIIIIVIYLHLITKDIDNTQKAARRPPKETTRLITRGTSEVNMEIPH